jgi:membrane associated rhomboid family serine protease
MIPIGDSPMRRTFPWVTVLIVVANIAVFAYELSLGPRRLSTFVQSVGTIPIEILSGRDLAPAAPGPVYVTLITAMFVHGGFLHIASNMLYLWVFGDNVEDVFGHFWFTCFYAVAGIIAGLTHVFVNADSIVPSVGASGAVAGVLGAYMVLFPRADVRTLLFLGPFITITRISAVLMIGFWFVTQLVSGLLSLDTSADQGGGVAFWAHIGGFVVGLVVAALFRPRRRTPWLAAW